MLQGKAARGEKAIAHRIEARLLKSWFEPIEPEL